ncbi:MAG: DNA polymerase I, partial [Deltaproteobacteria bacterium]|nr:DNA polymerase I [Deltaproteobacteria bacterium]
PRLTTKDGRPTNAIYGFVASLAKVLREKSPSIMVVVYDAKGPSFRKEMDPNYKANRPPMPDDLIAQQEPIRRIVQALRLPAVEITGLEADDVIATLTRQALAQMAEVVIISGDKDFYQLLDERVSMYDPNPKKEMSVTTATLQEKFGLGPAEFLEAQGLMGDSTDNIPGVPGIGEKTAAKLIREYQTLENLYENLTKVSPEKLRAKLTEHRASAFLSRDLARLKADADLGLTLDDLKIRPADQGGLREIYRDLEFTKFAAELEPQRTLNCEDYILVDTPEALAALTQELAGAARLALDLETTSLDAMKAEPVGLSLCASNHRAYYIPLAHQTLGAVNLDWTVVREALRPILENPAVGKINQNIKYDYIILRRHGLDPQPIVDDPMIASYILEPGVGGHNLNDLSRKWLGHDPITYQEVVGKQPGFDFISPEAAKDYACEDADLALSLSDLLRTDLEKEGLLKLYEDLELPLLTVLAEMEMAGVGLDLGLLADLSKDLAKRMNMAEERIYFLAGHHFNINSPRQLGVVLFDELRLPQGKKTQKKTGYSTDVEVLTDLAMHHELPAEILNYRTLAKLKSTYVDALPQMINPTTGRLHTSFNQAVTATGRLSSSDPNLQNIPIRTDDGRRIRQAFTAQPGRKMLAADYSQIELRILAHCSGDRGLQEAFLAGDDVHTRTAAEVFNVLPGLVSPDMR